MPDVQLDNMMREDSPNSTRRCVVLASALGGVPGALLRSMGRRGLAMTVVTDAASAMLEVVQQPVTAMVVVRPDDQPGIAQLVAAVRNYCPSTSLWQFEPDASGTDQLSMINGRYDHEPGHHESSAYRLDEQGVDLDMLSEDDATSAIVTRDELAMLLGQPRPIDQVDEDDDRDDLPSSHAGSG